MSIPTNCKLVYDQKIKARRKDKKEELIRKESYVTSIVEIKDLDALHSFAEYLYFEGVPVWLGCEYLANGKPVLVLCKKPTSKVIRILEKYGLCYKPHNEKTTKSSLVIHRIIPLEY